MIQFISQSPGSDEYICDILTGEYYIVGDFGIKFQASVYSEWTVYSPFEWTVFVAPVATGTQYWIRIDGVDYKVEPADTVESYLNRIRVPLHNAIMNNTLDELD